VLAVGALLRPIARDRLCGGATGFHLAELFRLWQGGQEESQCAHTRVSTLRPDAGPRPERGRQYRAGSPPYPGAQENGRASASERLGTVVPLAIGRNGYW